MARKRNSEVPVTIQYKALGTIPLKQLAQALWDDIHALADLYGVEFVTDVQFTVPVTNAFGDPLVIRHLDGRIMRRIDTHHYRPACLDYNL